MLIDTMSNFKKNNPVVAAEIIALEEDTGVFKKGDGKTHYNDLPEAGCDVTGTYARLVEAEIAAAKIKKAPIIEVEESKTLALTDAGTMQMVTADTAATITVPLFIAVPFEIGTEIDILSYSDADVTIAADIDEVGDPPEEVSVTIKSASNYVKIGAQNGVATLKKMDEDEWLLYGNLKASE